MYVAQGYKGDIGLWKYLIIPGLFFALMVLNYLAVVVLNIDVEALMAKQIEQKGEIRVLIELLAPLAFGLVFLLGWVKLVHQQSITSLTTARNKIDWKRIFFAFFLWGIITGLMIFLDYQLGPENYEWNFEWEPFLYLLLVGVLLIPLQTSFEEYLFRGYLMQGIGIWAGNRLVPLIATSVLFGLMHLGNPEVGKLGYGILVYYIGTGFFLGIITLMDEGIELAIGFHAANNLFTALLVTASWTAFQTPSVLKDIATPALGFDVLVPVFVVFPLLLYIFSKRYKWKNWKERLTGKVVKPDDIRA
ncbi:CPBP family intramembrane glutamic endopeptidase [Robertkochia aurantiaca]|uniref:CPBP family intramembrane glutamic endopeptidase n=1 Tax=Robertkochia aurantiaca TaxID=2873700 RepID=UPI001CCEABC7|nr:type II CAAX endopeptidase family protein [Robertkochia sp. 3YJGBD-33]